MVNSAAAAPKKVVRVTSDLGARMSRTGLDHDFYCPREFVPGRPGGFHKVQSRQACCILDKSLAVMEVIYLMRKCTRFVHGGPSSTTSAKFEFGPRPCGTAISYLRAIKGYSAA
jgi:hypothetical protein